MYSIVVPVYNSSASLKELCYRVSKVFEEQIKEEFEIILVDDCSIDSKTWKTIKELVGTNIPIKAFRFTKNFGQANALICGFNHAVGKWIITMDDDLQHAPEDIPLLLAKRDFDVVIAKLIKKKGPVIKILGSSFKSYVDRKVFNLPKGIVSSSFKLISREIIVEIISRITPKPFIGSIIFSITQNVVNVDIEHNNRKYKKSNYNLKKSIKLFFDIIVNNTSILLQLMTYLGLWISAISILSGIVFIIQKLMNPAIVQGWTSIITLILFSTGSILFCLGVIGEYIYRLLQIVELRKPYYIKEETTNIK